MFDEKEGYSSRLRLLNQFTQQDSDYSETEKLFVKTNELQYNKLLIQISEKMAKSKKTLDTEQSTFLRCLSLSLKVFDKMAFRQITSQKFFDVWKSLLVPTTPTKVKTVAFEALVDGLTVCAIKPNDWTEIFFKCLDLSVFKRPEDKSVLDETGETRFQIMTHYLSYFMEHVFLTEDSFISLFSFFKNILEDLYLKKGEDDEVNNEAHTKIVTALTKLKFSHVVYLSRYQNTMDVLEKVLEVICSKMLAGGDNTSSYQINMDAYVVIIEHYITGDYTNDLQSRLEKKSDASNSNMVMISPERFKEFQKTVLKQIEAMLLPLSKENKKIDDSFYSFLTVVRRIFTDFIKHSSFISSELKILLCQISRALIWRVSNLMLSNSSAQAVTGDMNVKLSDLAVNILPLWVTFMKDQKEWDLLFQKLNIFYNIDLYVKEICEIFISITQLYVIKQLYVEEFPSVEDQKKIRLPFSIKIANTNKLNQFKVDTMETDRLFFFWHKMFLLICDASCIATGENLEKWVDTMKVVEETFIVADQLMKHKENMEKYAISVHEQFFPFFVSVFSGQTNPKVVLSSITALIELTVLPVEYNVCVYDTFCGFILAAFEFSQDIANEIIPKLGNIFVYRLPVECLIKPIMNCIKMYQFDKVTPDDEFNILRLLESISLYDKRNDREGNDTFLNLRLTTECYTNLVRGFKQNATKESVLWAIGTTVVLNTMKVKDGKDFIPLIDIMLSSLIELPFLSEVGLKVLVFVVREIGTQNKQIVEYIIEFLTNQVLVNNLVDKRFFLFTLIEIFQANVYLSLDFYESTTAILTKLINTDLKENNDVLEVLASLLFRSMMHQRLSENINSPTSDTTWWMIENSVISVTPQQGGDVSEVEVRDPTGSWRCVVKVPETKEKISTVEVPKLEFSGNVEFQKKVRKIHNALSVKLASEESQFKNLRWVKEESVSRQQIKEKTKESQMNVALEAQVQRCMVDMELKPRIEEFKTPEQKVALKKEWGYILSLMMQYPTKVRPVIRRIDSTQVDDIIRQIDTNGMTQKLPVNVEGDETDESFKAFLNVLFEKNIRCQVGVTKEICLDKTHTSTFTIVWETNDRLNFLNTKNGVVIGIRPRGDSVMVFINADHEMTIGPLYDRMVVGVEYIIPLLKETILAYCYQLDQSILVTRLELIRKLKAACKMDESLGSFYQDVSSAFIVPN
ncbi:hypothetical protein EIN_222100 [Entamoeba invadens IP1]|uniref:Uncharacterized protein n=1 Tax=Entamoeba invadens IP1 TaxID=370355 RepID=A0A0A1U205_ENTIV|nr:hypothetical protein EIN_222100 [Entamoeba invadens IP1]ELP88077.1 hypothetical protein EIN_222100 [Entamoeba invadens IP1]|eukprot:XP_004254848.1 hypothetical protein EIN_222100 [Entamoeba invadens IP1]